MNEMLIHSPSALVAAAVCAGICASIFCYRRQGARYKLRVSLLAWALAAGAGCYALRVFLLLALGVQVEPVSPWLLLVLAVMLAVSIRTRGNVAQMLRRE